MNLLDNNSKKTTKIYGLTYMTDEEHTKRINESLEKHNYSLHYMPRKFRMNVYFMSGIEACKAADYHNLKQDGRTYNIFSSTLESLERIKEICENNTKIKDVLPIMYHKLTGYKIYDLAEDYFKDLKQIEKSENEEDNENDFVNN